jgi:hypothetical protein
VAVEDEDDEEENTEVEDDDIPVLLLLLLLLKPQGTNVHERVVKVTSWRHLSRDTDTLKLSEQASRYRILIPIPQERLV